MNTATTRGLAAKLGALQIELEALGFSLDARGSREAADVALGASARIGELREDCEAGDHSRTDVRKTQLGSLNLHETLS